MIADLARRMTVPGTVAVALLILALLLWPASLMAQTEEPCGAHTRRN